MKSKDLLLACYFERVEDQWIGLCLDFSLVTQANTLQEAHDKLLSQIEEYVHDATVGPDRQHASYLLRRRAGLIHWLKFYLTLARQSLTHVKVVSQRRKAERAPIPVAPVSCVA